MPRSARTGGQLPCAEWPHVDRRAWEALFTGGDLLDDAGAAAHWAPATRKTNRKHYARYLGWLAAQDELAPHIAGADRVSPALVDGFGRFLMQSLAPKSVEASLVGLKAVAKALAPEADWRWFDAITARLKRWARPSRDPDAGLAPLAETYEACLAELDRLARTPLRHRDDRLAFRDTLIVALFAAAPIRIRNMAMIEIDRQLVRRGDVYELRFATDETKNRRPLSMPLPRNLTVWIETYLARVRPGFDDCGRDALWLGQKGGRLATETIYQRVVATTRRLVGVAINPHRFRAIAATAMSDHSPAAPRLATPLLGHAQFATTERYYIRSRQIEASVKIAAILDAIHAEAAEEA